MAIQEKSIAVLKEGRQNFIGMAQTGTGKTAAFGLPLIGHINTGSRTIQGLILAPTRELCVQIAKDLQQKNIYVFMGGGVDGKTFADQLAEEGVQLGWETRLVPFGADVSSLIYALGFANRAALAFGGVKPGDFEANLRYNKDRIFAFVREQLASCGPLATNCLLVKSVPNV